MPSAIVVPSRPFASSVATGVIGFGPTAHVGGPGTCRAGAALCRDGYDTAGADPGGCGAAPPGHDAGGRSRGLYGPPRSSGRGSCWFFAAEFLVASATSACAAGAASAA